jgi:carboxylesterase type B
MKTPTKKVIDEIVARYPADPTNPAAPFNNFGTDISFGCCSQKLSKTFQDKAYRYVMSIPPATHALDQDYYFYINNETTPVSIDVPLARRFQRYLRNFIVHGDPNGANGLREGTDDFVTGRWPKYGSEEMIFNITSKGFETVIDPWSLDDRCEFMQSLINDPANGF